MDSIKAACLAQFLNRVENKEQFPVLLRQEVKPSFIYRNPSILSLSWARQSNDNSANIPDCVRLSEDFAKRFSPAPRTTPEETVVLLTASTGSFSTQLLHKLCSNNKVKQVICLNCHTNTWDKDTCPAMGSDHAKSRQMAQRELSYLKALGRKSAFWRLTFTLRIWALKLETMVNWVSRSPILFTVRGL